MAQVQWTSLIDDLAGLIDKKANDLDVYYALDRILDEVRSGSDFTEHIEALLRTISPLITSVNWHMIQSVLFGAQQIVEQFLRIILADLAANNNPSLLSRYTTQIGQWLQEGGVWLHFVQQGAQYRGKREVRDAAAQFVGALSLLCSAVPAPLPSEWHAELIRALLQWSDAQRSEAFETLEGTMMALGYWLYKARRQVLDDATHLQLIARLQHYTRYDNAQDNARYIRLQALRGLERAVRAGNLTSARDQLFATVIAPSLADHNIDVRKAAAQLMTSWARVVDVALACSAVSALLDQLQTSAQWEQRHGISHALYLLAQDRALVDRLDSALIARTMAALTEQVRHSHAESTQPRGVTVVSNAAALTALSELCMTLREAVDVHLLPVLCEALVSPLDLLQDAAGRAFYRLGTAAPHLLGTHRLELLALTYKSLFHSSHPIQELANRTRRDLAGDAQALVRAEWPRLMHALLREIASENPDVREAVWKAIDELSGQQLAGLGAEPWCAQIIAAAQHSLATEKSEFALAATCRALARYVALIEHPAQHTAPFWTLLAALWTDPATATGTVLTAAVECVVALLTRVNAYQCGPVPDPLVLAWIGLARDDEPLVRSGAVWSYARVTQHLTARTVIDTTRALLHDDAFEDRWCDIAVTWSRYGGGVWSRATPDERRDACHVALTALVGTASDDSAALAAWIHVLHDLLARDTSVDPTLARSVRSALLHVLTDERSDLDAAELAEWAEHLPEAELDLSEARDVDSKKKGKAKDKRQQALAYWLKLTAVSELFALVTRKFAQSEDEISSKYVELITAAVESLKAGDILAYYFAHVIDAVNKHDSTLGQQLAQLRPAPATQNLEEISAHWKSVKLGAEQWPTLLSQARAALALVSGAAPSPAVAQALVKSAVALLDQCLDQQDALATRLVRAQLLHVISAALTHVHGATVDDAREWLVTTWSSVNDADNALSAAQLEDPTADQSKEVEQWTHATAHAPFVVPGLVLHLEHVTGNLLAALGDERDELLDQVREEAFDADTDEGESLALLAALASVVQHTRHLDAALWPQCVHYLARAESLQNEQHYYTVARVLHTLALHLAPAQYSAAELRRVLDLALRRDVIHVDEGKSATVLFSVGYKLSEIEPSTALQQQLADMIFNEDIEDEWHMALLSSVAGTLPLPTRQESLTANETFHKTAQNIA